MIISIAVKMNRTRYKTALITAMNEAMTKPGMTLYRVVEHIVSRGLDAFADEVDAAIEKAANLPRKEKINAT